MNKTVNFGNLFWCFRPQTPPKEWDFGHEWPQGWDFGLGWSKEGKYGQLWQHILVLGWKKSKEQNWSTMATILMFSASPWSHQGDFGPSSPK